ncbi:cupin domain-containing protein [Lutimaribacter sp. EGI FJ00015]|uniref:Cupin domain-containing protein n=1 Tax=Lutimaribacter degradans TaxID=2945989 RepID=A0ACC6A1V4_9RHOB|nr:cupin domain-containing protein [Lutimaribacter sp. EGI FJ00013]MCM2563579.1 cupin domain-containing protein [Lutimaribacter sp. EGI FJ00013]MCO0614758.1 cupin domain-containing protein [Lutimaribacter sp. EGI FJ00015]MCO0637428.1 cupin domain-containing protein [Lutimaribacter sp. EGI FJ00014]
MQLNANFKQRALVRFDQGDWVASPMPGVRRRMLDRIGDEVARATSIVRFDPGSAFSPHTHDGGEEYLVLDGTFQDEDGDFPTGYYVRNPPTSSHTPAARDGATILVKLHQFDPEDRRQVQLDTAAATWAKTAPGVDGLLLHEDARERVSMERWGPGSAHQLDASGGLEVFVISGSLSDDTDTLGAWDWLRLPMGTTFNATAGPEGAHIWIKTGHLRHVAKTAP